MQRAWIISVALGQAKKATLLLCAVDAVKNGQDFENRDPQGFWPELKSSAPALFSIDKGLLAELIENLGQVVGWYSSGAGDLFAACAAALIPGEEA
jgi:hypothetical protein